MENRKICPKCESKDVLTIKDVIIPFKYDYICEDCGKMWMLDSNPLEIGLKRKPKHELVFKLFKLSF